MIDKIDSTPKYHMNRTEQLESIQKVHKETKEREYTQILSRIQSSLQAKSEDKSYELQYKEFQGFLKEIGYTGKPIVSLSQDEAKGLVSQEGFFGVKETSKRIADFVIGGAGGDEKLLRAGRDGVLEGFKQAEEMWGGKLPDIAYDTRDKALLAVDQALLEQGFTILDKTV